MLAARNDNLRAAANPARRRSDWSRRPRQRCNSAVDDPATRVAEQYPAGTRAARKSEAGECPDLELWIAAAVMTADTALQSAATAPAGRNLCRLADRTNQSSVRSGIEVAVAPTELVILFWWMNYKDAAPMA